YQSAKNRGEILRSADRRFRARASEILSGSFPAFEFERAPRYYWVSGVVSLLLSEQEVAYLKDGNDGRQILAVERANRTVRIFSEETSSWGLLKIDWHQVVSAEPGLAGNGGRVAILDTGIDGNHPALQGRVQVLKDFVGPGDEAPPSQNPYDDHGHGTHVAGTVAAASLTGFSAVGVAAGAELLIGKVMNLYGSSTWEAIAESLQWVMDPDGDPDTADQPLIVSNSWGVGIPSEADSAENSEFCIAVRNWRNAGILPVFAAGNFGPSPSTVAFPAACPGALAVGATDAGDRVASFSSRGPARWKGLTLDKPELVAPGVAILSTKTGGGYTTKSGTSMATPHVAGVAALIAEQEVSANPAFLEARLIEGVQDLGGPGFDFSNGFGRLNAFRSLNLGQK
ncbi:MAG: S8 family serine peptidase, partial [Bdellovibrionota bacterium]